MFTIRVVNYKLYPYYQSDGKEKSKIILEILDGIDVIDRITLFALDENTTIEKELEKLKQKLSQ